MFLEDQGCSQGSRGNFCGSRAAVGQLITSSWESPGLFIPGPEINTVEREELCWQWARLDMLSSALSSITGVTGTKEKPKPGGESLQVLQQLGQWPWIHPCSIPNHPGQHHSSLLQTPRHLLLFAQGSGP